MTKKKIKVSDKRNEIAKFVKKDFIDQLNTVTSGDLYICDDVSRFLQVDKIRGGVVTFRESSDGVCWRASSLKTSLEDVERYYKKIHLDEGESPTDAVTSLLSEFRQKMVDDAFNGFSEDEDEDDDGDEEGNTRTADGDTLSLSITENPSSMYEREALALARTKSRVTALALMAQAKANRIKHEIYQIEKHLHKVMKVLGMLETYLGTHELIFQITQGVPASIDEPISIRQLILYMDEEVGLVNVYQARTGTQLSGNVNFENIELFDEWVTKKGNINVVMPEKKGVVALRPSRNRQQYEGEDRWSKAEKEAADRMVYLLIRNGDNLYRIWTSLKMGTTLFPTMSDSAKIAELFENASNSLDEEKAEERRHEWMTNTLLLQGLVDRTDLFKPMPPGRVEFTNPATFEDGGSVRLIRDAESLLSDGHVRYRDWFDTLNGKVKRGTRILITKINGGHKEWSDRFTVPYRYSPNFPKREVYTVEEIVVGTYSERARIIYKPDDDVYTRHEGYHERKRGCSFLLYFDEFINYDDFALEDIDYYLHSRLDRVDYYSMMPVLIRLREVRIQELEKEKAFAKLLSSQNNLKFDDFMMAVDWWKKKVINKRPIASDDAKAWRMIIQHVKVATR